jgi:hypothetical protein
MHTIRAYPELNHSDRRTRSSVQYIERPGLMHYDANRAGSNKKSLAIVAGDLSAGIVVTTHGVLAK